MKVPTPYALILQAIKANPGTGQTVQLVKLVLSLWNAEAAYSVRECIFSLDDDLHQLSLKVIHHFFLVGEDEELQMVGAEVYKMYPTFWEEGYAGHLGKEAYRDKLRGSRQA
ncbi:hypothetical protein ACYPKM_00945 [Pseudomonas aeruginosa]